MSIRDELLAIKQDNDDGILHCVAVVDWAKRNKESALHSALEWDNNKAAHEYRLDQVRHLIQIYITREVSEDQVVSLSIDRKNGGGYRSVSEVAKRPDLRAIMLQDALDELARVQAKYERVQELASVWLEAQAVRARSGRKKATIEATAVAA